MITEDFFLAKPVYSQNTLSFDKGYKNITILPNKLRTTKLNYPT